MYVIIVHVSHVMSCVFMLDVVCVDYCTRYLLLLYDIISIVMLLYPTQLQGETMD